jgi:hypothetical protein
LAAAGGGAGGLATGGGAFFLSSSSFFISSGVSGLGACATTCAIVKGCCRVVAIAGAANAVAAVSVLQASKIDLTDVIVGILRKGANNVSDVECQ